MTWTIAGWPFWGIHMLALTADGAIGFRVPSAQIYTPVETM
jgi:hypothetical protein